MENNEELVLSTENVEELATEELVDGAKVGEEAVNMTETEVTTEEPKGKFYTDKEFDDIVKRKLRRQKDRLEDDFKKKYGADLELANVVRQGIGEDDAKEAVTKMSNFYKQNGVEILPFQHSLSQRDEEILAEYEAKDIISSGYDDLVEEVDRLAAIGVENMTPREKIVFSKLASERTRQEALKDLASIGVNKEALEDKDFMDFADKLNPNLSVKEKYEMYSKFKPKPKVEQMGSMKGATVKDDGVKDFYSYEESLKFTKSDLDKNPKLFEAIVKSMQRW